jgi:hypothetical protein
MSLPPPSQGPPKKRSPKLRATAPNSLMSDLALPSNASESHSRNASETSLPRTKAAAAAGADDDNSSGADSLGETEQAPVEPGVLADAISQLESLRTSAAPSRATSPVASGASSPHAPGVPTVAERIALDRQPSVPGTPHFGAQTDL